MKEPVLIKPTMARSYIGAFDNVMGLGQTNSFLNLAQKQFPDINLRQEFDKVRGQSDDAKSVPTSWLAEFWDSFGKVFPLDKTEKRAEGFSRRIGRSWWQEGSPLSIRFWWYPCLHTMLSDSLMKSIQKGIHSTNSRESRLTALRLALETLAIFFHEHFHCDIEVRTVDDKHVAFHVIKTPLTHNEDPNYRVFWGVLDGFCLWLRSPYHDTPRWHIDEELSTYNQIIIRHAKKDNSG